MSYFDKDFIRFFNGLEKNNTRDWFHANKKLYEEKVKAPFKRLVEDLIELHHKEDEDFLLEAKNAVFRINRDIRFSKDKSPYKLHVGAVISPGGRKDMTIPGTYIHFGAKESFIGGGYYAPSKENILAVREAIAENPKVLQKLKKDKTFIKYFPDGIEGDKNKRIDKRFMEVAEIEPLIMNKNWYFMAKIKTKDLVGDKNLIKTIRQHEKAGLKWNSFFIDCQ